MSKINFANKKQSFNQKICLIKQIEILVATLNLKQRKTLLLKIKNILNS